MALKAHLDTPIARTIWQEKYRFQPTGGHAARLAASAGDATIDDTFLRVAKAAASVESGDAETQSKWAEKFYAAMADFGFLPAGRILAGAGTGRDVTLFNCFVMGRIDDDLSAIFDNVREAALTMQQGGGIGHDFSTLRPAGALVASIGSDASGPVSFMDVWDAMCRTIKSAGARRGAMMATLRVDHPDIETFIDAKSDPKRLRNFNLSVLVTDKFMDAVANDIQWELTFNGKVYRTVSARALWHKIMRATYDYAEPGVVFIDRVNQRNNLKYCETIHATNPCGEQPLPPYGACLLGSLNLTRFVRNPFSPEAEFDVAALKKRTRIAVRLLDNMIDVSKTPLSAQRHEADAKRRIGLGVTGLADALIMLGARYDSDRARDLAAFWMSKIQNAAYKASANLAKEKGAFPLYDAAALQDSPNLQVLSRKTKARIKAHGLRNGCLTSIAPTGTISLLAGNVSSGIEPVFAATFTRTLTHGDGRAEDLTVEDYAVALHRKITGSSQNAPPAFVTAAELAPEAHLNMQAALQPFVDSSISKTINCDAGISFKDFESVYQRAYALGLKGCTTYRPNAVTGHVLAPLAPPEGDNAEDNEPEPLTSLMPASGHASRRQPGIARHKMGTARDNTQDVIYVAPPLKRDPALSGTTYKLKWPDNDQAIYITLNDIELDGRKRPYEIFINTRHLEHYAWTVALTRMISAVFRRGGDVAFVAKELKEIFDPQGGCWLDGRYVPSLLAAIGDIIEQHMIAIGFLASSQGSGISRSTGLAGTAQRVAGKRCPRCSASDYVRQESCWVCLKCGFSRCS